MDERYDVVVIGTGAGGATVAHALAQTGARLLVLERGGDIPREPENRDPASVWQDLRYRANETWFGADGEPFQPYTHYCVGGNTKFWGSVLYRLRREDFGEIDHGDGVSPAWPISYDTLAPYYERAEQLYQVHGSVGEDPTEPVRGPFPHPAVPHEEGIAHYVERIRQLGLHPSALPLGLRGPGESNGCILCNTCNSFPCERDTKSDADVTCVRPIRALSNVTLQTNARAKRLLTDPAGRRVEAVEVDINGVTRRFEGATFVVSCGAVNSAALLLRHGAPCDDAAGVSSVSSERRRLAENRGDQRFLSARSRGWSAAGPDPVPGAYSRRNGSNRLSLGPGSALGIQRLGGAWGRLVGHDRGFTAFRESGHPRREWPRSFDVPT